MSERSTLPGAPDGDDDPPIVLHVDLDCFYAACERLRDPELEGEPLVVGMGYESGETHGAVATASYEAREYGVESAQAISTALERLPRATTDPPAKEGRGYYRPVDLEYYEGIGEEVKTILHDCADTVREVSIDEAYLDVTDRTAWEVASGFGRYVKQRIDREVGLTASVGIAPTMHAAKVASDHDKPDGLVVVEPGEVAAFLSPLPIEELHGIGPVTAGELREEGIETVGELAGADPDHLESMYGQRGWELYRRANGVDDRTVEPRGRPKSLSRESAFSEHTDDRTTIRERVRVLAAAVADRASTKGALYQTIGIKVVTPPFDVNTRAESLPGPVDDPSLVESIALDLLAEFEGTLVRKVGVRVSNLSFPDAEQPSLDSWDGTDTGDDATPDDGPEQRAERHDPTADDRSEPADNSDRPESSESSDRSESSESSDRSELSRSSDRSEPSESSDRSEPSESSDQADAHGGPGTDGQTSLDEFE